MNEGEKVATDRDKLLGLLNDFGIIPHKDEWYPHGVVLHESYDQSGKITGYSGFYVVFEFDETGKFLEAGIWERLPGLHHLRELLLWKKTTGSPATAIRNAEGGRGNPRSRLTGTRGLWISPLKYLTVRRKTSGILSVS